MCCIGMETYIFYLDAEKDKIAYYKICMILEAANW